MNFTNMDATELQDINGGTGKLFVETAKKIGIDIVFEKLLKLTVAETKKYVKSLPPSDGKSGYYTNPTDGHFGTPIN